MKERLTVGQLKKALKDIPDDLEVYLSSDSGVDQCDNGEIVIEEAKRITLDFGATYIDRFDIYCNIVSDEEIYNVKN